MDYIWFAISNFAGIVIVLGIFALIGLAWDCLIESYNNIHNN